MSDPIYFPDLGEVRQIDVDGSTLFLTERGYPAGVECHGDSAVFALTVYDQLCRGWKHRDEPINRAVRRETA